MIETYRALNFDINFDNNNDNNYDNNNTNNNNCVRQNAYYLRPFLSPRVLRCPAGIDRGCWVISGFDRHLGLCDTPGLDVILVSIRCQTR